MGEGRTIAFGHSFSRISAAAPPAGATRLRLGEPSWIRMRSHGASRA